MKASRLLLVAVLAFGLASLAGARDITPEFDARVIHVDDGDTLVALRLDGQKSKIRLANIDAPETSHGRCRPGQPWSEKAAGELARLVKGRTVRFTCHTLDRYDRAVCDVLVDGTTASRELARRGVVWANRASPGYLRDREVGAAEAQARAARQGLWADPNAIPPWEWRRTAWQSSC